MKLWGPNDGGVSTGTTLTSIPGGGNFLSMDGGFETGPISQTITGLTQGAGYLLSFYWADAQQTAYSGATTDSWTVSFGNDTQAGTTTVSTGSVADASKGFTPWVQASFNFVATSATQTLSFLAVGSPAGVPPFSLLSDVSLTYTPEPSTWAVLVVGLVSLVGLRRWRRGRGMAAAGA